MAARFSWAAVIILLALLLPPDSICCELSYAFSDDPKEAPDMPAIQLIFATYIETEAELGNVCLLAESIRTFGGRAADAPVWVMMPDGLAVTDTTTQKRLRSLKVEVFTCGSPEEPRWLYYSFKPYAAAKAETLAEGIAAVLIWMDNDAVFLGEPSEFFLASGKALGYRPIMHNRSGTLKAQPPSEFWGRIYERLALTEEELFPMVTSADHQTVRAYFNCGLIVVRPEKGILRRWPVDFEALYRDSVLAASCRADVEKRIFLHQTALTGLLNIVPRETMVELSDGYNYPIFFDRVFGADHPFNSIQDAIMIRRIDGPLKAAGPDWHKELIGPPDKIAWLKERLSGAP